MVHDPEADNYRDVISLGRAACRYPNTTGGPAGMAGMAYGFTAEDRQTQVLLRCSHEEKAQLHKDAEDLGITLQALLERRVLGKHDAIGRAPGRKPKPEQDETLFEKKELMAS